MKKITFFFTALVLFTSIFFFIPTASADFGIEGTAGAAGLSEKYNKSVPELAGNIIGAALSMIGVIFFVLMVYGGFLWMTARGDDGIITKAKDTIIAAVIGLVIVLGSYAITRFIFDSAASTPVNPAPPAGQP